jgi:hypothetical protein
VDLSIYVSIIDTHFVQIVLRPGSRMVNQCELTDKGKKARDELLELLYSNSYDDSQLGKVTGLHRHTIAKVLGKKSGNIQLRALNNFFKTLLKKLKEAVDANRLSQSAVDAYLQRYQLVSSYSCLESSEESFSRKFKELYDFANTVSQPLPVCQETQKESKAKKTPSLSEGKFTHLLWDLDYKQQERDFEDALHRQSQCVAFSIAAPCDVTQRWILNRLVRKIPNREDALKIAINIKEKRIYRQFDDLWKELSKPLSIAPSRDRVLQELCADSSKPIILILYDFRQFERIQRQLLQDFWEPLTQKIVESNRSLRSRIVLFFVDQCCPSHHTENIVMLDPLERIPQRDVIAWVSSDAVTKWGQSKARDGFEQNLRNRLDGCQEPYSVLDAVCVEMGLENGVSDVEEAWRWAS